jgi:hypothetical protein
VQIPYCKRHPYQAEENVVCRKATYLLNKGENTGKSGKGYRGSMGEVVLTSQVYLQVQKELTISFRKKDIAAGCRLVF